MTAVNEFSLDEFNAAHFATKIGANRITLSIMRRQVELAIGTKRNHTPLHWWTRFRLSKAYGSTKQDTSLLVLALKGLEAVIKEQRKRLQCDE